MNAMKKYLYPISFIVICIVIIVWWWFCSSITTIVLIRHADRDGENDALTQQGLDRADEFVHVAEKLEATTIYHSGANRTELTVTPLATALGITMIEQADSAATINDILNNHRGETVIVAGHSNTVPQMIELAGGPALANIQSTEYDNMFVLTRCNCWFGGTKLLNFQYGAVSP